MLTKFSIIDYILKEARVDRWALLQEMQLTNMVNQFAGKNSVRGEDKKPYFDYAKTLNESIIKKLKIDYKTEKLILIWLLEQVLNKQLRVGEDDEIAKNNLDLYFSNRRDIDKNIFQVDYNTLKDLVEPYQVGGEERKFLEFLSKPIAQGNKLKVYKIEDVNTCLKIGPGTSWCIQGERWAKSYLERGPLFLITKNNKRYALLSFAAKQYMDTKDVTLKPEDIKEIREVLPDEVAALTNELKWIKNPSKEKQLAAVKEDISQFSYISNPDKEVQLAAVNAQGNLVQYIKNPDKEVQLAAVKQDGKALKFLGEIADKEVQLRALENGGRLKWIKNPDKEVQRLAIRADAEQIEGLQNPDKDIQLEAVSKDLSTISYIPNPDKDVQLTAIKKYFEEYPSFLARTGVALKWVKKWIKNIHPDVLKYIQNLEARQAPARTREPVPA